MLSRVQTFIVGERGMDFGNRDVASQRLIVDFAKVVKLLTSEILRSLFFAKIDDSFQEFGESVVSRMTERCSSFLEILLNFFTTYSYLGLEVGSVN